MTADNIQQQARLTLLDYQQQGMAPAEIIREYGAPLPEEPSWDHAEAVIADFFRTLPNFGISV